MDSYYPTIESTFSSLIKYRSHDYATEIVDTAGTVSDATPALVVPDPHLRWTSSSCKLLSNPHTLPDYCTVPDSFSCSEPHSHQDLWSGCDKRPGIAAKDLHLRNLDSKAADEAYSRMNTAFCPRNISLAFTATC